MIPLFKISRTDPRVNSGLIHRVQSMVFLLGLRHYHFVQVHEEWIRCRESGVAFVLNFFLGSIKPAFQLVEHLSFISGHHKVEFRWKGVENLGILA